MISGDTIFSINSHDTSENIALMSQHWIVAESMVAMTYKIQVQKFQTVRLRLTMIDESVAVFYLFKGPGFLSKRYILLNANRKLAVKSFQCIVQVAQKDPFFAWVKERSIYFFGKSSKGKTMYVSNGTLPETIYFSSDKFRTEAVQSVYLFLSTKDTVVNVTVRKFVFTGEPNNMCVFRGVAVFQFGTNLPYEEFLFCNKYLTKHIVKWHVPRSVFSIDSSSLLVFYIHKEYSTMEVEVLVAHSPCKILKPLNMCEKLMEETGVYTLQRLGSLGAYFDNTVLPVDSNKCTIVQVSSWLYKVFKRKGPINIHSLIQHGELFPKFCHFKLLLGSPINTRLEADHTVHVYGECCYRVGFGIKPTESVSLNAQFSLQRLPQSEGGKRETKVTSVSLLSRQFYTMFKVTKKDFLAKIAFVREEATRLNVRLHYLSGSWLTLVVQARSKNISYSSLNFSKDVELIFPHTVEELELNMPVSSSLGKVMWLQHVAHNPSQTEVQVFHLEGTQENRNGYSVTHRIWTGDNNTMASNNEKFVLATPGIFSFLIMCLHSKADGNQTIIHLNWISGTNTNTHFSKLQADLSGMLVHIQSGKYKFFLQRKALAL